ncbi:MULTISPECIES: right-handed parallel beta-helix repeat-containing protein [Rhodopseudomonas]|uniref:Uncharacterized protein n=1 Tax=Rhodopseudomonas palustris TaxID=1076 RepID=A0A0D7F3N1_RHOPL|nr:MULTISPECIES: right-handed parallel beta-helix repeat-containing protein [Rhodopseudomonas]KIZ47400.1 hypothetical protein OO17_04645 [Rhodopseudomonas palustris]MDF3809255.1 hypothetical protein [Rhodopseudomonas sp. BAL398]WOK19060.1 hypothetical protein RBJ75_05950 [Rhodopseudomonas sp. BAL398]
MSTIFEIPRGTRQQTLITSGAQTVFGPFDFILFDERDLELRQMAPNSTAFALISQDQYSAAPVAPATGWPAYFTITLAAALPSGTILSVKGTRLGSRTSNVTQGGVVRSVPLEKELDTQVAQLQELRRDIDAMVASGATGDLIASGIANNSPAPGGTVADALEDLDIRASEAEAKLLALRADVDQLSVDAAQFPNTARVTAAFIAENATYLRTAGYATPGDWGGALYKKVASEPTTLDKVQSADGAWWQIAEPVLDPRMFGAVGNGIYPDMAALNAWYAALRSDGPDLRVGRLSPGRYTFSAPLVWAGKDNIQIVGAGRGASVLVYNGAATDVDLITFGDNSGNYTNNIFSDFSVSSDTMMTGGYAFRLKGLSNSIVKRVNMDGQHGSGKLWHGIYFDGIQICRYEDYETYCQRDGVSVSGTVGAGPKALMHLKEGWQLGTNYTDAVGIRIGGAFGGVYIDAVDVSGAMYAACIVDETLKAEQNREIFFWNADFDAGHTYSLIVRHSDTEAGVYRYNGSFFFSPVLIETGDVTNHVFNACTFSPNLGGDGLRVDAEGLVLIDGCLFASVDGYDLNITTAAHNVIEGNNFLVGAGLGAHSAIKPRYLDRKEVMASIASATTTDLGSTTSQSITISGTTTISSFGSSAPAGALKTVAFSGDMTLTHNATSLILPGAANIAVMSGSVGIFRHEGSGNWRCLSFTPYGTKYVDSAVTFDSPLALTTATPIDMASLSLPPGTWEIRLHINFALAASTNITRLAASISLVSATPDGAPGHFAEACIPAAGVVPSNGPSLSLPSVEMTFSETTSVFAIAFAQFTVSTCSAWGLFSARRVP